MNRMNMCLVRKGSMGGLSCLIQCSVFCYTETGITREISQFIWTALLCIYVWDFVACSSELTHSLVLLSSAFKVMSLFGTPTQKIIWKARFSHTGKHLPVFRKYSLCLCGFPFLWNGLISEWLTEWQWFSPVGLFLSIFSTSLSLQYIQYNTGPCCLTVLLKHLFH